MVGHLDAVDNLSSVHTHYDHHLYMIIITGGLFGRVINELIKARPLELLPTCAGSSICLHVVEVASFDPDLYLNKLHPWSSVPAALCYRQHAQWSATEHRMLPLLPRRHG